MKDLKIPLHKSYLDNAELASVGEVLKSGKLCGDGPVSRRVQLDMCRRFGSKHALLTSSCTHAMELSLMVLGIGPGDEVICPSFSFVSTANAIVQQRARPVFGEILEDTLNLDPGDVEAKITTRTRAILVVHYAGIACDMDAINALARHHNLAVIEDAAHAVGARYKGKFLGTFGEMGCYSFHETKNITCGEGGAFLTDNAEYARRAEIMREKGTDRAAFLRGEVDKYTWRAPGSSYVLSEMQSAILAVQFEKLDFITRRRQQIFQRYLQGFEEEQKAGKLILPIVPNECQPNGHIFYVRVDSETIRNRCLEGLRAAGIGATFHFIPLHSSPFGRELNQGRPVELAITDRVSRTLLRLPIYPSLTDEEVDFVILTLGNLLKSQ
jgi:dTDP-4-amino-4,6-dideoxygalactose transaminase